MKTPTAFEWHNYETGHCYVDYVPHVDGKSNILDEKNGYTKIPLYSQQPQKERKTAIKTAMQIIKSHLSCNCNEMYESRRMIDPNCVLHEYATEIELMMEEYRQQTEVTDEEIKKWAFEYVKDIYNNLLPNEGDSMPFDSGAFQLWLNLMVEAAKAMRDNPEQFKK